MTLGHVSDRAGYSGPGGQPPDTARRPSYQRPGTGRGDFQDVVSTLRRLVQQSGGCQDATGSQCR